MEHHQKPDDAAKPDDVPTRRGGPSDERPQRRGTTTLVDLAALLQETAMSRQPSQVPLVEDTRIKNPSNERSDEIVKATEKKLRERMLASNSINDSIAISSDVRSSEVPVPYPSSNMKGLKKISKQAENVQETPVISNNTRGGRKVSAIVQNLAELEHDTLASHPSDCLIVEDTRLTRTSGDDGLRALESRRRASLLTKSPQSRHDDGIPDKMEKDRTAVIYSVESDMNIKARERSASMGLSRPPLLYPGKDGKSAHGRQVAMVDSPLRDTAPALVHIAEPQQHLQATPGMISFASPTYRIQHGHNGKSGNQEDDLGKQGSSDKEHVTSNDPVDLPVGSRGMIDGTRTGAFFVSRDGTRVIVREKINLPTQPSVPAGSQLNLSGWQQLATDEDPPPSPDTADEASADEASTDKPPKLSVLERILLCPFICTTYPFICTKKFKVLIVLLVVSAVVVAIAVPLSQRHHQASPSPMPTNSSPTSTNNVQRQQMVRIVISNITATEVLDDASSPQHMAFNWIVQTDQLSPIDDTNSADATQKLVTRYSLATFYYSLRGDQWFQHSGWLNGQQDECSWQFVTCSTSNTVQSILIGLTNNLAGSVPPEVQHLSSLRGLDLSNNAISGIPDELGNLTELDTLNLLTTKLIGSFPSMLYRLTTLVNLNLGRNSLQGSLPSDVSRLSNLQTFLIGSNKLTGSITSQLQTMTALQYLDLSMNQFSGDWQEVTRGLFNLTRVLFFYNAVGSAKGFGGHLDGIEKYTYLSDFSFSQNRLTGTIPTELGLLTELTNIDLSRNQLNGTIPSELEKLTKLSLLDVSNNPGLNGSVPQSLCQLTSIARITAGIPCNCSKCTRL